MYDELIKRLRCRNLCVLQMLNLMDEAADAIEDLEKSLAIALLEYQRANNKLLMTEEYAKQKQRWIPVTEQLPEHSGNYLVYSVGGNWKQLSEVTIGFWDDKRFIVQSFFAVTHWMPLPESPESEGE